MVKRLCISLSDEDAQWLDENNESPSKLIQDEIKRIRAISQTYSQQLQDMQMKVQVREEALLKLNQKIMDLQEVLDKNGIVLEK